VEDYLFVTIPKRFCPLKLVENTEIWKFKSTNVLVLHLRLGKLNEF